MHASNDLPAIDPIEADRRLREEPTDPLLLDVREVNEFVAVRAPGAALLPTSAFIARIDELPVERPLMIICRTGSRSAAVTAYLLRSGRVDVVNVTGGMDLWERVGLPTRRGPLEPGEGALPG
jgi:rhodanese-related sulfurtransferase